MTNRHTKYVKKLASNIIKFKLVFLNLNAIFVLNFIIVFLETTDGNNCRLLAIDLIAATLQVKITLF